MSNNYSRRTNIRSRRMKCVSKAAAVTKTSLIIAIIKEKNPLKKGSVHDKRRRRETKVVLRIGNLHSSILYNQSWHLIVSK